MRLNVERRANRHGLTLLELVIVLAILAALAGLLLPLAGTYLEKAHAGAAADNFKEVSKVVQQYQTVTRVYPDSLDSLQEDTAAGTIFTEMPGGGSYLGTTAVTADILSSLNAAGITSYATHATGSDSSTFGSTSGVAAITTADNIVTVAPADVLSELGVGDGATGTYAIFGLGSETNLIGSWMQEAPYHFPEEGNPNTEYNRFGLVFDVTGAPEAAAFVGVLSFHEDSVVGPLEPLAEFFE